MICVRCYNQGFIVGVSGLACPRCGNDKYFIKEKKMTEEKALQTVPQEWGEDGQIVALGKRLKFLLPGGSAMQDGHVQSLAQYSKLLDANPFRGEVYGYTNFKGELQLVEGYKLLVRWAKRQCPYTTKEVKLDAEAKKAAGLTEADISYDVFILRDDQRGQIKEFVEIGASFAEAYELVAFKGSGTVLHKETIKQHGQKAGEPIDPPTGWTWDDVAKKRALKNALNQSHGMPSPKEIAEESWMVGDTETEMSDWLKVSDGVPPYLAEKEARLIAQARMAKLEYDGLSPEKKEERFKNDVDMMRGNKEEDETFWEELDEGEISKADEPVNESELPTSPEELPFSDAPVLQVIVDIGYSVDEAEQMSVALFDQALGELDDLQQHNIIEYAARHKVLKTAIGSDGKAIRIPDRFKAIPEIAALDPQPKNITEAALALKHLVQTKTQAGDYMTALEVAIKEMNGNE